MAKYQTNFQINTTDGSEMIEIRNPTARCFGNPFFSHTSRCLQMESNTFRSSGPSLVW